MYYNAVDLTEHCAVFLFVWSWLQEDLLVVTSALLFSTFWESTKEGKRLISMGGESIVMAAFLVKGYVQSCINKLNISTLQIKILQTCISVCFLYVVYIICQGIVKWAEKESEKLLCNKIGEILCLLHVQDYSEILMANGKYTGNVEVFLYRIHLQVLNLNLWNHRGKYLGRISGRKQKEELEYEKQVCCSSCYCWALLTVSSNKANMYMPAIARCIKANLGVWCFSSLESGTPSPFRLGDFSAQAAK